MRALPPGSQVAVEGDCNGQKQQIAVTLGKRPPAAERRFEQFGPVAPVTEALPAPSGADVRPPPAPGPAPAAPAPSVPRPEAPSAEAPSTGAPSTGAPST